VWEKKDRSRKADSRTGSRKGYPSLYRVTMKIHTIRGERLE
jgi:hypothetical protein